MSDNSGCWSAKVIANPMTPSENRSPSQFSVNTASVATVPTNPNASRNTFRVLYARRLFSDRINNWTERKYDPYNTPNTATTSSARPTTRVAG